MIKYKIDKSQEIIFATISESFTTVNLMTHISNILGDPDFSYSYHSIITIDDNLIIPHLEPEMTVILRDVIEGYAKMRKGSKWAFFISNETTHALVETVLDLLGPLSANIRLFQNTNDAIAWIKD